MGRGSRGFIVGVLALVAAMALAPSSYARALKPQEQQLFDLMNDYRVELGLPKFTLVPALNRTAQWYANDIAETDGYSHTHIDSIGRVTQERYLDYGYHWIHPLGEASLVGLPTAAETLKAWQDSPGHDEILRDKRLIAVGVGYAENDAVPGKWYWVASFGPHIPGQPDAKEKAKKDREKAAQARKRRRHRRRARRRAAHAHLSRHHRHHHHRRRHHRRRHARPKYTNVDTVVIPARARSLHSANR